MSDGEARIFIPNSYAMARFEPTVSRVAPDWNLSDALPTELQHHGRLSVVEPTRFPGSNCVIVSHKSIAGRKADEGSSKNIPERDKNVRCLG